MRRLGLGLLLVFVWGCDGAEQTSDAVGAPMDAEVSDAAAAEVSDAAAAEVADAAAAEVADAAAAEVADAAPDGPALPVGARLEVVPEQLAFGAVPAGEEKLLGLVLRNTGDLPLHVNGFTLIGSPAFSLLRDGADDGLADEWLASTETAAGVTFATPISIDAGGLIEMFSVRFKPAAAGPAAAELRFTSDAAVQDPAGAAGSAEDPVVTLSGFGGPGQPALVGGASLTVRPQTMLHLLAPDAVVNSGTVARYEWRAVQPVGSQSVLLPSPTSPQPRFEANVAGAYEFELLTWDQDDQPAFEPLYLVVEAVPDQAIHVELLWDTPNDADQTDEGPERGADLDLHFTHPFAVGQDIDGDGTPDGWFDQPFDTYWFNAHPNWGSLNPAAHDNPSLDRDDTDGAGPENLNLAAPEDDVTYRIGAHYWSDHGFGCSYATVRVYIHGELTYERAGVPMAPLDFWEVASIDWPSGAVTSISDGSGGPRIVPAAASPLSPAPNTPALTCPWVQGRR